VDGSLTVPLNVILLPYGVASGRAFCMKFASFMLAFDILTSVFLLPSFAAAFTASFDEMPCDAPIDTTVCTSSMIRLNSQMRQSLAGIEGFGYKVITASVIESIQKVNKIFKE
jgi:hypothetical protein